MVTGVEAAGLVLASLPLVVNQLDAYVQGLETIKSFRTRRYRRQLESYSTRLCTQQAILLNTLEFSLKGVINHGDDISDLIYDPQGPLWKDAGLEARLRAKLDRNYDAFVRTATELSSLLEELCKKLGLSTARPTEIRWDDASVVQREIKKFRDIFSKSIYADLLSKIENANAILGTLIEQVHSLEGNQIRIGTSKQALQKYNCARRHAANLYNAIVRGKCWNCSCKDQHCIYLQIEPQTADKIDALDTCPMSPRFRMAFSFKVTSGSAVPLWYWKEVETEPVTIDPPVPAQRKAAPTSTTSTATAKKSLQCAVVTSTLHSLPWPQIQDLTPSLPPISDMCSTLRAVGISQDQQRRLLGFICDESVAKDRYNMYLVRKVSQVPQMQSLADLLALSFSPISSSSNPHHMVRNNFVFSRRDRLFLAATLASSVIQFHGSWLKTHWDSRDILFLKLQHGPDNNKTVVLNHAYLSCNVLETKPSAPDASITTLPPPPPTSTALIKSQILFPLGLALVELSLCQPLVSLCIPEDSDPIPAVSKLKTAARLLRERVYRESGIAYGDVVDRCLFWPSSGGSGGEARVEDEGFQEVVFERVIEPLLEDLRNFEGGGVGIK